MNFFNEELISKIEEQDSSINESNINGQNLVENNEKSDAVQDILKKTINTQDIIEENKEEKVIIELENDEELNFFYRITTMQAAMYKTKLKSIDTAYSFEISRKEIGPLAKSSSLPISILKKLWYICDRRGSNSLLINEAVVYLHYIRLVKNGLPVPRKMLSDLNRFIEKGVFIETSIKMDKETLRIKQEQLIKEDKLLRENDKFKKELQKSIYQSNIVTKELNQSFMDYSNRNSILLTNSSGFAIKLKALVVALKYTKKSINIENSELHDSLSTLRNINNIGDSTSLNQVKLSEVMKKATDKLGSRVANISKLRNASVELVDSMNLQQIEKVSLASAKLALEEENDELRRVATPQDESKIKESSFEGTHIFNLR